MYIRMFEILFRRIPNEPRVFHADFEVAMISALECGGDGGGVQTNKGGGTRRQHLNWNIKYITYIIRLIPTISDTSNCWIRNRMLSLVHSIPLPIEKNISLIKVYI